MIMRFRSSGGNHCSHMTLGTRPNMVPPSRRKLPQLMISIVVPRLVVIVISTRVPLSCCRVNCKDREPMRRYLARHCFSPGYTLLHGEEIAMGTRNISHRAYYTGKYHLLFQTAVILAGMGGLFGLLGWMIFGTTGLVWALVVVLLLFLSTPRVSPWMVLKMYRARQLSYDEAPGLFEIVSDLSRRADLPAYPLLYYVPRRIMNAF